MFRLSLNDSIKGLWDAFSFTKHPFPQRHFNSSDSEKRHHYISLEKNVVKPNKIKYQDGFILVFDVYTDKGGVKLWLPDLKGEYAEGNHLYGASRGMDSMTLRLDVYAYGTFLELLTLAVSEKALYVDIDYIDNQLVVRWDNATARINNLERVDMIVPETKKQAYKPLNYHLFHTKERGCTHVLSEQHNIFSTNTGTCLKVTRNVDLSAYDFSHLKLPQRTDEQIYNSLGFFLDEVDKSKPFPEMDVQQLLIRLPKTRNVKHYDEKIRMEVNGTELSYPFVYYSEDRGYQFGYITVLVDDKSGNFIREISRWNVEDNMRVIGFIQTDMLETINKFDYKNKKSNYKGLKVKDLYTFGVTDLGHKVKTAFCHLDKDNMVLSPLRITHKINGLPEYWYQYILDIMPHSLV